MSMWTLLSICLNPPGFPLTKNVCACFLSQVPVFFHILPCPCCFRYPVIVTQHDYTAWLHTSTNSYKSINTDKHSTTLVNDLSCIKCHRSNFSQVMPQAERQVHISLSILPNNRYKWLTHSWQSMKTRTHLQTGWWLWGQVYCSIWKSPQSRTATGKKEEGGQCVTNEWMTAVNLISSKTVGVLLLLTVCEEQKMIRQWHIAAQVLLWWRDSRGHRTRPIGLQPHYSTDEGDELRSNRTQRSRSTSCSLTIPLNLKTSHCNRESSRFYVRGHVSDTFCYSNRSTVYQKNSTKTDLLTN